LIALHTCRYSAEKEYVPHIERQIQNETRRAAWLLACISDLENSDTTGLLISALRHDLSETRSRLFYLFSFIYDPMTVRWAHQAVSRKDLTRHAYAMEVMDSVLSGAHKTAFMPLLENYPERERLKNLGSLYAHESLPGVERIKHIALNKNALEFPWLAATALYMAIQLNLHGSDQNIAALLNSNEPTLVRFVQRIETESTMLSTFERVIILKSIGLFANTPDEALAELATLLEEIEVPAGQNVVEQGAAGDSLYVIVRGRVAVLDGENLLNELEDRAVFGELALLDSEPRTATVRALEDVTVLRLTQDAFYDLMSDYVEVAMGTIQMLTRTLRARTTKVVELNRLLKQ